MRMHKADHLTPNPNTRQTRHSILAGILLQVGLGVLLGYSSIRESDPFYASHIDDMAVLLVLMTLLIIVTPLRPQIGLYFGRRARIGMVIGLAWCMILALWSRWYYFRGVLCSSADPWIVLAVIAVASLPVLLLLRFLIFDRQLRFRGVMITKGLFALLALCLMALPLNMQLGQLPLIVLTFILAFYAGFLLKDPRVLLFVTLACALETLAFGLHKYASNFPFAVTREACFLRLSGYGLAYATRLGRYLILLSAISVALLNYVSKRARYLVIAIIGYLLFCLILTKNRGALMGVIVALAAYAMMRRDMLASRRKLAAMVLALMVCVSLGVWINLDRANSNTGHMDAARWALKLFAESPLIGNGIGAWRANLDGFAAAYGYLPINFSDSHNVVTEVLCSAGLIGISIALLVVYCTALQALGVYSRLEGQGHRNAFLICLAGSVGYVFSTLVEFPYWAQQMIPCVPVLLGIWSGIASSRVETPKPSAHSSVAQSTAYAIALSAGLACLALVASRVLPVSTLLPEMLRTRHFQVYDLFSAERPYGNIVGTVKDEHSRPIRGVRLILSPGGAEYRTDRDGAFVFKRVRKRTGQVQHLLTARCPGYHDVTLSVNQVEQVRSTQTSVDIKLTRLQGSTRRPSFIPEGNE